MNERRNEWVLELFNEVVDQLKQWNNNKVEGWQPFRASFYCSIYGTELGNLYNNPLVYDIVDETEEHNTVWHGITI